MCIRDRKQGVPAERVARDVYREAKAYLDAGAPVGEYLADQLMLWMGLAAGQGQPSEIATTPLSSHSETHIDVLKMFLDVVVDVEALPDGRRLVRFRAS